MVSSGVGWGRRYLNTESVEVYVARRAVLLSTGGAVWEGNCIFVVEMIDSGAFSYALYTFVNIESA